MLLVISICSSNQFIYGQHTIYLGVKGGLSIPNLSTGADNSNPLSNGYTSRLGANISAFVECQLNQRFSIQTELCYSEQGGKHNGIQAIVNPNPDQLPQQYLYADFNNEAKLHYFMLPVQVKLNANITGKIKLYIQGGVFAGVLLSAQTVAVGNSYVYMDVAKQKPVSPTSQSFDHTENIYDKLNPFNVGVIGAVGFSMEIFNGKIFIEGGGNYGFINIQKHSEDGKNYTGAGTVQVGYAYHL